MLINQNSICSILSSIHFSTDRIEGINKYMDENMDELSEDNKLYCSKQLSFHKEKGFRKLVLSKPSLDIISKLEVPKTIRINVLRSLPNNKDIIQVDEKTCIKYMKTEDSICFYLTFRPDYEIRCNFFYMNLIDGRIHSTMVDIFNDTLTDNKGIFEKQTSLFLRVITFLELTDIELELVTGTTTKKQKLSRNIKNTSKFDVILVTSKWNTYTFNVNPIDVRGHWRLQPYGPGLIHYKYIWIKPFQKGITRRKPQKELV